MENIYRHAIELLQEERSFVYAAIISQDGSTPRGTGSKMLVLSNEIRATIGGGLMEAQVIEEARELMMQAGGAQIMQFDLSGEAAASTEFVCGGNCEILLFYIDAQNPIFKEVFFEADKLYREGGIGWLITTYNAEQNTAKMGLRIGNSLLVGEFDDDGIDQDLLLSPLKMAIHHTEEAGYRYIFDPVHSGGLVYLFGAGHVSVQVAKLTTMLEFETVVVDDRADYLTTERFPGCRLVLIDSMEKLPKFPVDQDSYILIITRGHVHDETVLRWAMKQNAGYIGMIGSYHKRDVTYEHLRAEGVAPEKLQRVYSPIGLNIGGQTPAEIGVSIAAQLVQVRNEKRSLLEGNKK